MPVCRRGPLVARWFVLLLGGLALVAPARAQVELYVTSQQGENTATPPDAVVVYEMSSEGRLTFKRSLTGRLTKLSVPGGLAVVDDRLFVANRETGAERGSITIHDRAASLNTAPLWILRGPQTGLDRPVGLAVRDGELFVANQSSAVNAGSITVYKLQDILSRPVLPAPGGVVDLAPDRSIEGPLSGPTFVAVTDRELFVTNNYSGSVTVHERTARGPQILRTLRNPGAVAFVDLMGVAVDDAELFVSYGFFLPASTIAVYGPGASKAASPLRTLNGILTTLDRPAGLALAEKYLVVANRENTNTAGSILVFDRTAGGDTAPLQPPFRDDHLFSPVAVALAEAPSFDYTLKIGDTPLTVAPGSRLEVKITAELRIGSGSVTFLPVAGLPAGTGASFDPATCLLPCETTLRLDVPNATRDDRYPITIAAAGTPIGCQGAACAVRRSVSSTLMVRTVEGFLEVVREGAGTVNSTFPDGRIDCGSACSKAFPVGTVELTAQADPGSTFRGWSVPNCVVTRPCQVTISESTTTRIAATFDQPPLVSLTVELDGSRTGTVTGPGVSCRPSCSTQLPAGTSATLTPATADPGADFAGWLPIERQPRCVGVGTCIVTLDGDVSVRAYFGTPPEAFIARLYLNVLRTTPPVRNVQELVDALKSQPDLAVRALVDAFFGGGDFQGRLSTLTPAEYVTVLYRTLLRREPAADERTTRIREFFRPVVGALIASPEFQARIGRTQEIVTALYLDLFGRTSPPGNVETAPWVDRLNRTGDFTAVVLEFLTAPEYLDQRETLPIAGHLGIISRALVPGRETSPAEIDAQQRSLVKLLRNSVLDDPEFTTLLHRLFPPAQ